MVCRLPSSSRYWNRSCPGRSWHALTIFATAAVLDLKVPLLAALALELEPQLGPFDLHVRVAQGGQPVALVLLGVIDIADADERVFQEMDDRRQNLFARQTPQAHVLVDGFADRRKRLREGKHVLVFRALAHFAESRVIAVLLAPLGIPAGRLNVAVGFRRDPHIRIGRRDGELADPLQRRLVGHRAAVR